MSVAKEIRSKIKSIESTKKITHAMELVAASKMKKSQAMMHAARPFALKIKEVLCHLVASPREYTHPFLEERTIKKAVYVVIASKRGLCGGLNVNLFKSILNDIRLKKKQNIEPVLCLVGTKAINFFKKINVQSIAVLEPDTDIPSMNELIGLIGVALRSFENKDVDALYLCYNNFENSLVYQPTVERLLPFNLEGMRQENIQEYLYEEDPLLVLDMFLTRYIEAIIYQSILENYTSEQAARMVAMKSATDNATTLIDDLKLVYNKARQAAITREITEIVSGAAALN
jgi:F-type H+-transporting ATPase subunit gamma